jgi:hypothetical protein
MSTRWQDITEHLTASGFDVPSPGTAEGVCKATYIVVKHNGTTPLNRFSTNIDFYDVLVYVPQQNYSDLEGTIQRVKAAMKELEPMVLPTGNQTPSFYEAAIKAHMISVEYKNYKKRM